jgi:Zn-dependent protease with chaperone function
MWWRALPGGASGAEHGAALNELREEYDLIVARSADLWQPVPVLEVDGHKGHSSSVVLAATTSTPPRVRLSADLLSTPPVDRAWSMAHELGHVLRHQNGERPAGAPVFLAGAGVLGAGAVACVFTAGAAVLHSAGFIAGVLAAGALGQVGGLWLVLLVLMRREESATDAVAAAVFGEVLTPAGVERLCRYEGALSRYVPTLLRSHPRPKARRAAGLVALDHR